MKRNCVVFPSFPSSRIRVGGQHLDTKSLPTPVMKGARIQVPGSVVHVKAKLGWAREFLAGGCRVPAMGPHTVRGAAPPEKGVYVEGWAGSRN